MARWIPYTRLFFFLIVCFGANKRCNMVVSVLIYLLSRSYCLLIHLSKLKNDSLLSILFLQLNNNF